MSYERGGYRGNDGLDASNTSDAYGGSRDTDRQTGSYTRGNDGLDPSGTSDAYGTSAGDRTRGNDGLDSNTSDVYDSGSNRAAGAAYRGNDGLDPSGTTDAQYGDRSGGIERRGADDPYGRTSGGLGVDDTIGDTNRTGGHDRGGDQEKSEGTSGGLGQDDTYGTEGDTGGNDTGMDHNYGMGSGRTHDQEIGGVLPTEVGRTDSRSDEPDYTHPSTRPGDDDNVTSVRGSDSQNKAGYTRDTEKTGAAGASGGDSTMGKMMEKAGGMFKNEKLQQRGAEKRQEAGAYDGGNY